MFEALKGGLPEVEFWNAAGRGKKTNEEWKQFFEGRGFRAGVDFPPSLFYEKLMEIFPDAKVVLTIRDIQKNGMILSMEQYIKLTWLLTVF